jgi:hypothetical protein
MHEIAIKMGRDGKPILVHRSHDLSGTEYERLATLSRPVADRLVDVGVVTWLKEDSLHHGVPGVLFQRTEDRIEADFVVRADAADPTTVVASGKIALRDALNCVDPDQTLGLDWIVPPEPVG